MKTKRLQKMQLKKATISRIKQTAIAQLKGGTRTNDTDDINGPTAMFTHCEGVVCY